VLAGHRRFARHWSVQQLRIELADTYHIPLSDDAIERSIHRYQQMLAARHRDPQQLVAAYAQVDAIILAIDGLQPEKGHETLYVVRALVQKRVWFAEALLSSATTEVQQLLVQARIWAERLGKPVRLWMSDKQDAFVQGIAAEFPGVPHRYCANHFLRDVAKPMLEADSRAKVKMRRTIRGLRTIEREV
jgi:MULE transposase domain